MDKLTWFRCCIRGENFPGQMIGQAGLVGFYVTRFVKATGSEEAEAVALKELRAEPKLAPPPGYAPTGQAHVIFESIDEVDPEQVPAVAQGFSWYPLEDTPTEHAAPPDPSD